MYKFFQQHIRVPLEQAISNCQVSFAGPYSCLFCNIYIYIYIYILLTINVLTLILCESHVHVLVK